MRVAVRLVLSITTLVVAAAPAGAHVEVRDADPAVDGTVPTGTDELSITFITMDPDEPVAVTVADEDGEDVDTGQVAVGDTTASGTTVVVPVEPLEEGDYVVSWAAMSTDGDGRTTGTYGFTVEAPPGSFGVWLLWIVAIGIPAALYLRSRLVSRRRSPRQRRS